MVEGSCDFVSEEDMIDALAFAQEAARPLLELQEKLRSAVGLQKRSVVTVEADESINARVQELAGDKLSEVAFIREKQKRYEATDALKDATIEAFGPEFAERKGDISAAFSALKKKIVRTAVVEQRSRIDGRRLDEVRPIHCEIGVLPRPHGSALFTRGETQALATVTLGSQKSDQRIESIMGDFTKSFMLHYNFPPFSTGEARRFGSPGRREIGHGNLAERSLLKVMPAAADFPYVTRIVSEVLESNGSSSMASVCGGSLALMDAGVPVAKPVAGIAMGLIQEGDSYAVLSDILGDEDHLGDMDFKVTGSREGVVSIQMDIKLESVPRKVLEEALLQAKAGRLHILDKMSEAIESPRGDLSDHAPRIVTIKVPVDKIRDVIGPGGKMIRAIQEETGADVNIEEDGTVTIAAITGSAGKRAIELIESVTAEAQIGALYNGKVKRITDFGAFVEVLPGTDGLVHISELEDSRVERVEDVCKEGEMMIVKVLNIERGKIRLSRKEAFGSSPSDVLSLVSN